jgi:hypothetical protein
LVTVPIFRVSTCYEFACDSYAVYDPVSNEISGYSRTVDYWWEGWYLFAESLLGDPNGGTADDVYAGGYSDAEADVSYVPGPSGGYEVHGVHSYGLEDNIAYDGDSYYDVWVAPPPVVSSPTGQLTWYSLDPTNPHSIDITGTGFTDLPWIWGCDGGIDQSSWALNSSTDITGSLHVSTGLSSACTVNVRVDGVPAFTIALAPGAPPQFRVVYESYIPTDHVNGPTPCLYGGVPFSMVYKGDPSGTYRTAQGLTAVPDLQIALNPSQDTGLTRNYGFGSPANGSYLSQLDEDGVSNDCYLWNAQGQALANWTPTASYSPAHQETVHMSGSASNPLEPPFGSISWNHSILVDTSNANDPKATVAYSHTCYPAHEIWVNGMVVYSYQPPSNSTVYIVGCLTGWFDQIINVTGPLSVPKQ